MVEKRIQPKFSAILAADVVGHGRRMGRDEAATPETPRDRFRDGPDTFIPGTETPMQCIADGQALGEPVDDMCALTAPAGTDSGG